MLPYASSKPSLDASTLGLVSSGCPFAHLALELSLFGAGAVRSD